MSKAKRVKVAGKDLDLSNLDKVMFPAVDFTKGQVIEYYTRVAASVLPHLKNRPITLKRFPDGIDGEYFYEKDAPSFTPGWIKTFPIPRTGGRSVIRYILINDLPTLVWSANMANLELHPFLARVPRVDRPTSVVFDLDPGEGADILSSCEAAFLVKGLLDRLNLACFAKVSGSKGIHLHVPLNTAVTYGATRPFAKSVARMLEAEQPDLIVSEMLKEKRAKKVFVDWSQNSEHKSTVAVYSLRAKRERPFVSMPVTWEELKSALDKADAAALFFEPEAALRRLEKAGDLFAPVLDLKQKLPAPFLELARESRPEGRIKPLAEYRRKRDFSKTPEPPPSVAKPRTEGGRRLFVIQKHDASRLHYDLRLQMHGVLKSWAVPKGPPFDLNEKRLAMATEDHPLEYAGFEGTIPKGEYGGGTVMVWDTGSYEVIDGNYYKGRLHLLFAGRKLKGEWILVKNAEKDGGARRWLWIKTGSAAKRPPPATLDRSVLTSRPMEEIARAKGPVWHSNRGASDPGVHTENPRQDIDFESLPPAASQFIEPMLAKPVAKLPDDSDRWAYEIKFDGYRALAVKDKRRVTLFSRNKNILNRQFPGLVAALKEAGETMILDGEIVALDEKGRPSFNALQNYRPGRPVQFYAFDLLAYKGKDLLKRPLEERRVLLERAIGSLPGAIRISETFDSDPETLAGAAKELGLEGLIAKRRDSLYEPGLRTGAWVKLRVNKGQELVIGGYIPAGDSFDSLLVGYYEKGQLLFIAKVRNGFVPASRRRLLEAFKGLETAACPFANLPEPKSARRGKALTREEMRKCKWLQPKLVAQIEFTDWTEDDHLRHSSFVGLRRDKRALDVRREVAE